MMMDFSHDRVWNDNRGSRRASWRFVVRKKKSKNIVGPNHNTSQESTAEIPNQGNQSGVPIPESYLCSTHLSTIYFIPTRTRSKLVFFFRPDSGTVPKEKRKEKKNSGLGVFQEKRNAGG
jgi:hypothetical protein